MKQIPTKTVFLSLALAFICAALAFVILAWQGPSQSPPLENIPAPINVGPTTQVKTGVLGFDDADPAKTSPYFIKESSGTLQLIPKNSTNPPSLTVGANGYVGIGTTAAASKQLDVSGQINGQKGLCIGNQCCSTWGGCAKLAGCASYNWIQQTDPGQTGKFSAVSASSEGTKLVVAAANGQIYISPDLGTTWSLLPGSKSMRWTAVASSADATKFAAISDGNIYVSTDAGATWNRSSNNRQRWTAVAFFNNGLLASSSDGSIYFSANSNLNSNWSKYGSSMTADAIAVSADGVGLAAIRSGSIYISTDGGATWNNRRIGSDWSAVAISMGGVISAAGNRGVITSGDGGATWWFERIPVGLGWQSIAASSDGSILAAIDETGSVWTNQ